MTNKELQELVWSSTEDDGYGQEEPAAWNLQNLLSFPSSKTIFQCAQIF
jgi:hypothetical protein